MMISGFYSTLTHPGTRPDPEQGSSRSTYLASSYRTPAQTSLVSLWHQTRVVRHLATLTSSGSQRVQDKPQR
ncbi:hypothetical protein C8Q80DRAFT_1215088 [Daedaleopsis nitida]|nr:hypothetical protein C8Q80DRAFT_1215088 [Daedaleopsis nitida]